MNRAVFDTRFFHQLYYTKDEERKKKIKHEKAIKEKFISAVVIYELYKLSIAREGREIAKLKAAVLKQDFKVVSVDDQIAELSAELSHKYRLSMGDSIIAATALVLDAVCISDDPHFQQIKEIKTAWI